MAVQDTAPEDSVAAAAGGADTTACSAEAGAPEMNGGAQLKAGESKDEDESSRGVHGLTLSRVGHTGMTPEPDEDDEVEPIAKSSLVCIGGQAGDPADQGDARDLISRDLLDELSNEHDGWNEARPANADGTTTPPTGGGYDARTPSEPGTPQQPQHQYYQTNQNHDGLMCIDQWDWKTDAPEFVPGSMKTLMSGNDGHAQVVGQAFQPWGMQQQQQAQQQPLGSAGAGDGTNGGGDNQVRLAQIKANYEWQVQSKADELRDMQQRNNQLEIETAQVRASWEIERRSLVRQIGHYRSVLERYCIPIEEAGSPSYNMEDTHSQYFPAFQPSAPSQWPSAPSSQPAAPASNQATGYGASSPSQPQPQQQPQATFAGVGFGAGGASGNATASITPSTAGGAAQRSSLDSKMEQLNNLLQEGSSSRNRRSSGSPPGEPETGQEGAGGNYTDNSIASTLRAMFPHATIRTKSEGGDKDDDGDGDGDEAEPDSPEAINHNFKAMSSSQSAPPPPSANRGNVDQEAYAALNKRLDDLEDSCVGHVDDRAMKALQALSESDKQEALAKVEDVVKQQGGQCRNLSSILQSVCRKIEKRRDDKRPANGREGNRERNRDGMDSARGARDGKAGRRARRIGDEDGDAFDSSDLSDADPPPKATSSWPQDFQRAALRAQAQASDEVRQKDQREPSKEAPSPPADATPQSRRSKSWADIQSGDEDEGKEGATQEDGNDPWTTQHIDTVAQKGFELRKRGDHWDLKISMGSLQPRLTELGMERYCRWLRQRLSSIRQEHGQDALHRCRGEIDFSHNHLTNQMVWGLLEALAQSEVHVALLKLYANNISQGGVLAICEFIRKNERAEALQELHLSHNEIDDDSALELLRTLGSQRPRYPPKRSDGGEFGYAPVWLRLNLNRIRDPNSVIRRAEDEGMTICTAWDRQVCGTTKCVRRECPLVHLYSFQVQDIPKHDGNDEHGEGKSRRHRDRGHRDRDHRDRRRDRDRKKDHDSPDGDHGKDRRDSPDDHRHDSRRESWGS